MIDTKSDAQQEIISKARAIFVGYNAKCILSRSVHHVCTIKAAAVTPIINASNCETQNRLVPDCAQLKTSERGISARRPKVPTDPGKGHYSCSDRYYRLAEGCRYTHIILVISLFVYIYIYIVYTYYNYTLYTYVLLAVSGLLMITYVHM